jgi:hypothetical protein
MRRSTDDTSMPNMTDKRNQCGGSQLPGSSSLLRRARNERGVVIVAVLMVLAVASALAVSLIARGRSTLFESRLESETIEARLILDSALSRALLAVEDVNDPMLPNLRTLQPFVWRWSGKSITLDLDAESGKVDLNAGEPLLLRAVLRHALGPDSGEQALGRLLALRRAGKRIESPAEILETSAIIHGAADRLEHMFTTLTAANGLDPLLVENDIRTALAEDQGIAGTDKSIQLSYVSRERPVYAIKASWASQQGRVHQRQVIVFVPSAGAAARIVSWRSAFPEPTGERS